MPNIRFNGKTAILILAAMAATSGCAALRDFIQKPVVEFESMKMTNLSLFQGTPVFTFNVTNPNPIGMKIRKFEYDFKINDKKFVKGVTEKGLAIAANASRPIELPFTINHLDLFDSVLAFGKTRQVKYDLSGTMGFEYFDVPYHKTGTLDIPELPKITLKNVDVGRLSSRGASVTVVLELENANPFAVKLTQLGYALKLGGNEIATGKTRTVPLIDKNGASTLAIPLTVSFAGVNLANLGNSLWDVLTKSSSSYELTGEMTFDIPKMGKRTFPFQKFGETPVLK